MAPNHDPWTMASEDITPRASEPLDSAPEHRVRVLVIDDDRGVAEAIGLELKLDRVESVIVDGGAAALALLQKDRDFDVILCDLMMPGLNGIDVYERAILLDGTLGERFVVMTGGAFTPRAERFLSTSIDRLEKPFGIDALVGVVAKVARRRRASRFEEDITPCVPAHRSKRSSSGPTR
jgi:DNA-binding NtrC family response regulator